MANSKISELPSGSPAQPTDEIPIARGGANYSLAASAIAALGGGIGIQPSGNTAGATAVISSGTAVFAGGNNITLSQAGQSITISGGAAGGVDVTIGGNVAGAPALVSTGTLFLAGGNNVTLSQNGQSVTISANTAAAAILNNGTITALASYPTTAAYYFNGNTTGQSSSSTALDQSLSVSMAGVLSGGWSNGSLVLSASQSVQTQASGNIGATGFATTTIAGSLVAGTNNTTGFTLAVPPFITTQTVQTQNLIDVSLSGNTSGALALVSSGTLILAGGNNITLSQNGQSVTISGPNAGGAQTGISGIIVSNTTYTSGTVSFSNANGISFGSSAGQAITASYTVPTQTAQTIGVYASSQTTGQSSSSTVDARSFTHVGQGIVSVGLSGGSLLISATTIAQTNQTLGIYASSQTYGQSSSSTIDARSLTVVGSGNVSVGLSAGSLLVSAATAAGLSTGGIYNVGNTTGQSSSSTFQLTSLNVSFAGIMSGGWSNSSLIISAPNSTGLTQSLYATSNTTQSSSGTQSIGSLLFAGAGIVSVGVTNGSVVISATGGGGAGQSIGVSTGGNTSGNTGTYSGQVVFAGGNNITLSVSSGAAGAQTITISGANAGGAQTGISALVVSNTTYTSGTVTFQNANGISFGSSGANGISASYTVPTQESLYALGNTTQNSSTVLGFNALSFNGLGAQTVGFSNGSIQLSVPVTSSLSATGLASISVNGNTISIGAALVQLSQFQPLGPIEFTTVTQNGNGSVQVYPAVAPFPFTATRVDMMASVSAAILAVSTQAQTLSMYVGLYSLNASTLSLASSGSQSYAFTNSSNNSNASITGLRRFSAPINVNYTGGFDLYIAVMSNTTFVNTNGISMSNVAVPIAPVAQLQGLIGQVPANSMQFVPGQGFFSVSSAALPSSIGLSAISGIGSTGSNAYAVPVQFVNVTA
jgi:trimeric autotransporter adhesin